MPVSIAISEKVRKTVRVPRPLYDEAESFVERKIAPVESFNDFFVAALLAYVKLLRRKQIDLQFACLAEDADYQKEARLIAEEFNQSDWEAFQLGEQLIQED